MDKILGLPIGTDRTVGDVITGDVVLGIALNVVAAFVILFVALTISGWVRRKLIRIATDNEELDLTLFSFLANILRYAILAMALVFILNRFGIQTTSLVAVIGAAGLAIGLAMQGALSSIAAGIMLVIFHPFRIGDFVEVDGLMGTVKDISIVATELATLDNLQVIVPNSNVWGAPDCVEKLRFRA
ncbi:MAG: mechanosensitive ion channel [Rhodobacteraceae bacterium]|nr:mechanosensitive ion channel [Paracoccaceae bacterium]